MYYDVILRRVRITDVSVEKQCELYFKSVYLQP